MQRWQVPVDRRLAEELEVLVQPVAVFVALALEPAPGHRSLRR
jgi:hypothetical protein